MSNLNSSASFLATLRGVAGQPMADPLAKKKASAARKAAKAQTKAARKAAAVKRQEEQKAARQRRLDKKLAKQARKVNRVNKPTVQAVKPATTPVVTQRHIEELRRRDWLRERPSQGQTQAWVNAITPEEEEYELFFLGDLEEHSDGSVSPNTIRWGEFEALERKLAAERKWAKKELGWQQMLVFVKAKYGVELADLTCDEWESKQLSSERVKALGLRSPKLSKAMVALGIPQKEVAVLLGANYTKNTVSSASTKVLIDKDSCKEQGNSIHYSSCQATDSRAQWGGGNSYYQVHDELGYMGKSLFLWVVGEPMSKDGKGFEARAKLRVMYADRKYEQVAGLYIDRPYGKHQMLLDNLDELQAWWSNWCEAQECGTQPILMPPVWNRDNGAGNDFQYAYGGRYSRKLYCPSAEGGYQDTLTHGQGGYDCFVDITAQNKSLLLKAYTKRSKFGGVYYSALTDVVYNPQKGEVTSSVVALPTARASISQKYRVFYAYCRKWFGATGFSENANGFFFHVGENRYEVHTNSGYMPGPDVVDSYKVNGFLTEGHTPVFGHAPYLGASMNGDWTVFNDCPELGFYKAIELPYKANNNSLTVKEDLVDEGFMKALDIKHSQDALKLLRACSPKEVCLLKIDSHEFVDADNPDYKAEHNFLYGKEKGALLRLKDGVIRALYGAAAVPLRVGSLLYKASVLLGKDDLVYMSSRHNDHLVCGDLSIQGVSPVKRVPIRMGNRCLLEIGDDYLRVSFDAKTYFKGWHEAELLK